MFFDTDIEWCRTFRSDSKESENLSRIKLIISEEVQCAIWAIT